MLAISRSLSSGQSWKMQSESIKMWYTPIYADTLKASRSVLGRLSMRTPSRSCCFVCSDSTSFGGPPPQHYDSVEKPLARTQGSVREGLVASKKHTTQ